jgi:hypothetical protein
MPGALYVPCPLAKQGNTPMLFLRIREKTVRGNTQEEPMERSWNQEEMGTEDPRANGEMVR